MNKYFLFYLLIAFNIFSCESITKTSKNHLAYEHNERGSSYLNYFLYDEAIVEFKKAVELSDDTDNNKGQYIRNLGLTFLDLNQKDSAVYYYKTALNFYPKNTFDYYCISGDIDLLAGNIKFGLLNLKKAIRLNPENVVANNAVGLLYSGTYGEEYIDYKRALKYNIRAYGAGKSPTLKFVLASNYYHLEEMEKAEKLFEELIEFNRLDADSRCYLGLISYFNEDFEKAKEHFRELSTLDHNYDSELKEIYEEIGMSN